MEHHWRLFDYGEWDKKNKEFDHETYNKKSGDIWAEQEKNKEKSLDTLFPVLDKIMAIEPKPPWKPHPWYNYDGDQIETYVSHEDSYAHWVCPSLSLHLSRKTDEIVGFTIHGIKHIIERDSKDIEKDRENVSTNEPQIISE